MEGSEYLGSIIHSQVSVFTDTLWTKSKSILIDDNPLDNPCAWQLLGDKVLRKCLERDGNSIKLTKLISFFSGLFLNASLVS